MRAVHRGTIGGGTIERRNRVGAVDRSAMISPAICPPEFGLELARHPGLTVESCAAAALGDHLPLGRRVHLHRPQIVLIAKLRGGLRIVAVLPNARVALAE